MIVSLLVLCASLFLLIFGAHLLLLSSVAVAKRFHISTFVIGATIVAWGTSLPELFVTIVSTLQNSEGVAIGNVLGSKLQIFYLLVELEHSLV